MPINTSSDGLHSYYTIYFWFMWENVFIAKEMKMCPYVIFLAFAFYFSFQKWLMS